MDPHEIQARAVIAAALIQSAERPLDAAMLVKSTDAAYHEPLTNILAATDVIYRKLTNQK